MDQHDQEKAEVYQQKQKDLEQLIRPLFTVLGSDGDPTPENWGGQDDDIYTTKSNPFNKKSPPSNGPIIDELD